MKESQEFTERKELMRLQEITDKKKHDYKMKEIKFMRESDELHHERELTRGRIKGAEIRKNFERKQNTQFANEYWKK